MRDWRIADCGLRKERLHPASNMMIAAMREAAEMDRSIHSGTGCHRHDQRRDELRRSSFTARRSRKQRPRERAHVAGQLPAAQADPRRAGGVRLLRAEPDHRQCLRLRHERHRACVLAHPRRAMHERVLCGGYDAISEMVFVGFDSLQAATPERIRPFDGIAADWCSAKAPRFSRLRTWDLRSDAARRFSRRSPATASRRTTIISPSRILPASARARPCSARSDRAARGPSEIDYINAHGTATAFNDATEGSRDRADFSASVATGEFDEIDDGPCARRCRARSKRSFPMLALRDQFLPPNINYADSRSRVVVGHRGERSARGARASASFRIHSGSAEPTHRS